MSLIPVEYHGVHVVGPEQFTCAILRWAEEDRILPVWLSPIEGGQLAAAEEESVAQRPSTHDLLADALGRIDGGVSTIGLTSYHEGVFIATIVAGGEELDARASDALVLAVLLDMPILVDEEILTQASLFIRDDELTDYIDIDVTSLSGRLPVELEEEGVSASGDYDADADFEAMMRSLGVTEEDFDSVLGDADTDAGLDELTDGDAEDLDDDDLGDPYRDDDS